MLFKLALAVSERRRATEDPRRQARRKASASPKRRPDSSTRPPRWPAAVALLGVGALYGVLSDGLTLIPRAFLLGFVAVLLVPLLTAHLRGSYRLARGLVSG